MRLEDITNGDIVAVCNLEKGIAICGKCYAHRPPSFPSSDGCEIYSPLPSDIYMLNALAEICCICHADLFERV